MTLLGHLRHSALRTIRGGICWGFIGLVALLVQLLLLGYQRMGKMSGFIGILLFLRLLNIFIVPLSATNKNKSFTLLSVKYRGNLSCCGGRKAEDGRTGDCGAEWRMQNVECRILKGAEGGEDE